MKINEDKLFAALHELVGYCGHCCQRNCAGRHSHSKLPSTISVETLNKAIEKAKENDQSN